MNFMVKTMMLLISACYYYVAEAGAAVAVAVGVGRPKSDAVRADSPRRPHVCRKSGGGITVKVVFAATTVDPSALRTESTMRAAAACRKNGLPICALPYT